jgi:hypothetical protein
MLPGEIIFEKVIANNIDNRPKNREHRDDIDEKSPSRQPPPILLLLPRLRIRRLEVSDNGDKRSTEKKQRKEMPDFPGQKMFADELHGRILILA